MVIPYSAGVKHNVVVRIAYPFGICWIRFVGTHKDYEAIDVTQI